MSLWKWNNVELEIDMEDVEFQERYENVFQHLEEKEKSLLKQVSCQKSRNLIVKCFGNCLMNYSEKAQHRSFSKEK